MGEMARLRARTAFDWQRHVDAYDALHQALTEQTDRIDKRAIGAIGPIMDTVDLHPPVQFNPRLG